MRLLCGSYDAEAAEISDERGAHRNSCPRRLAAPRRVKMVEDRGVVGRRRVSYGACEPEV